MRKHGETYSIQEIHPHYFDELNDFDHKLSDVKTKLSRAQEMRDSLRYCEIKNDGMQLLIALTRSKVMNDFSYHHSKTSINIQSNDNFEEPSNDVLQLELRDKRFSQIREDITKILVKSNQALDAEKRRIHDFEVRCNQISQDQNKKINELNLQVNILNNSNNDLKNEQLSLTSKLDSSKAKINKLKEERDNLKTKKDDLNAKFNDLKNNHITLKTECKDLKIEYSNTKDYLKKCKDYFKTELGKLSQEKKDCKKTIDKLNEESKKQLFEIESIENFRAYADKYLSDFYTFKTEIDGGTGKEFYMEINWKEDADREVFKLARAVRSRHMRGIEIWNFGTEQNKNLLDYLIYNCPDQLRSFYFNALTEYGSADYYLNGIAKVASATSEEVYLSHLKFSKEAFEKTVKASANSDRIVLRYSQINLSSDIDLSGPHYNTSFLSFNHIGIRKENEQESSPERLERVIKAISLCSLKDSLKSINVYECGIGVKEVEEILENYKLENVRVIEEVVSQLIE